MRLHVITTGGTIDVEYSLQGRLVIGEPMAADLLRRARTQLDVSYDHLFAKDSQDLDDDDRALVARRITSAPCDRVIVTHGTDTMTETAAAVAGAPGTAAAGKVIVLTGAMQPARMADSDAAFNLGLAVAAVQTAAAGVYIAMSGRVFPAHETVKDRLNGVFVSR